MPRLAAFLLLWVPLVLGSCASPDSLPENTSGLAPADEFISRVTPGSENEQRLNRGIGATPTY